MAVINDEILATIYERMDAAEAAIAALQTQTATMQGQLATFSHVALNEYADLNTLGVGLYYIPNSTVCATLLNKPITGNATGFIEVVEGGADGQLMMYYRICSKDGASYYQRAYYQGSWGEWHSIDVFDSGWLDLSLNSGITAYSEEQKPRYRRVGKEVFLSGVIKGITASNTDIATLPANYRPSKKVIFAVGAVGQIISRLSIDTNGVISYNRSTIEPIVAENYHSIACSFNVD